MLRARASVLVIAALALGCAPLPTRAPVAVHVGPIAGAARATRGLPPPVPASCAPRASASLRADEVHTEECWPDECRDAIPYWVDNCTNATLYVLTARTQSVMYEYEIDPRRAIAPGTRARFDFPHAGASIVMQPGVHELRVGVAPSTDAPPTLLDARVTVIDAAKERVKAECAARGDDWGNHGGFVREEGCEPVMRDAGRACSDERDCTGQCVLEREQDVSPSEKRVYGHCSRFRTVFGCRTLIGTTDHGRMPRRSHFVRMCVD